MHLADLVKPRYFWDRRRRALPKLGAVLGAPLRRRGWTLSPNDARICACYNRHAGRRAFILGNGPSLRVADLEALRDEITFASNKIYLAFDSTSWRPTYYFVFDRLVAKNNAAAITGWRANKFFPLEFRDLLGDDADAVWLRVLPGEGFTQRRAGGKLAESWLVFSTDALLGVGAGETVVFNQLQLAFYMGITTVYLLGVDFSFDLPKTRVATAELGFEVALRAEGERNHFHPNYRQPGEVWAVPRLEIQLRAFSLAKEVFERAGRQVFNASRRTKLAVFPRVELDLVLAGQATPQTVVTAATPTAPA